MFEYFSFLRFLPINDRLLLILTENDVNPPINNDPMEKRNEFIDHPAYNSAYIAADVHELSLKIFSQILLRVPHDMFTIFSAK